MRTFRDMHGGEHPYLTIPLPRPVTSIHQIESTSLCSLACKYCPWPTMPRPKQHMPMDVFRRTLEWVSYYRSKGTQGELNLAGIGESTLHPQFLEMLALAREAMGPQGRILFATNGIGPGGKSHDEAFVKAMVPYRPAVYVSLHRPERANVALHWYKKHGLLAGLSADPSLNPNSWAGQIESIKPIEQPDQIPCPWMRQGWAFVLSDGRISRCCLDSDGTGVIGHVNDEIDSIKTDPWRLCPECYQIVGIEGYDQRGKKGLKVVP